MTLQTLLTELDKIIPGACMHAAVQGSSRYIVLTDDGLHTLRGDGAAAHCAHRFTVHLVTQQDDDPALGEIMSLLERSGAAFSDPESMYDDEMNCLHHVIEGECV